MSIDVVTFVMGTIVSAIFLTQVGIVWYTLRDLEQRRKQSLGRQTTGSAKSGKAA